MFDFETISRNAELQFTQKWIDSSAITFRLANYILGMMVGQEKWDESPY